MHTHTFTHTPAHPAMPALVTLTLPDSSGRYELHQQFGCVCGAITNCTSWARNTGRHLTYAELREVGRQERLRGYGQARRAGA